MQLIWHGTAAIEIAGAGGRIVFDPFVPLKGSETEVRIEEFDGFSDIFITHGHIDHILSIPEIIRRNPSAKVYCTKTAHN